MKLALNFKYFCVGLSLKVITSMVFDFAAFGGYGIVLQAFAKNAHADSLVFSMLRDAFCAPVLFFAAIAFERTIPWPQLREVPLLFTLGLLGMFGNQVQFHESQIFYFFFNIKKNSKTVVQILSLLHWLWLIDI